MQTSGERLASLRQASGLTQAAFAERIGVSPVTVCRWERGRSSLGQAVAKRVAKKLRVSAAWLLFGEG